jgi:hypothetical protein
MQNSVVTFERGENTKLGGKYQRGGNGKIGHIFEL